jgi:hypothetical protein
MGDFEGKKSDIRHQLEDIIPEVTDSNIKTGLKIQEYIELRSKGNFV